MRTHDAFIAELSGLIPLTAHLGLQRLAYDDSGLQLGVALAPNLNDKGTGFGGALYSLCVLAGWSWITLLQRDLGLRRDVVIRDASIHHLSPVDADFDVHCGSAAGLDGADFVERLQSSRPRRIEVESRVLVAGEERARFRGTYTAADLCG